MKKRRLGQFFREAISLRLEMFEVALLENQSIFLRSSGCKEGISREGVISRS